MIWVFDKSHKAKNSGFITIFKNQKMARKCLSKNDRFSIHKIILEIYSKIYYNKNYYARYFE